MRKAVLAAICGLLIATPTAHADPDDDPGTGQEVCGAFNIGVPPPDQIANGLQRNDHRISEWQAQRDTNWPILQPDDLARKTRQAVRRRSVAGETSMKLRPTSLVCNAAIWVELCRHLNPFARSGNAFRPRHSCPLAGPFAEAPQGGFSCRTTNPDYVW